MNRITADTHGLSNLYSVTHQTVVTVFFFFFWKIVVINKGGKERNEITESKLQKKKGTKQCKKNPKLLPKKKINKSNKKQLKWD